MPLCEILREPLTSARSMVARMTWVDAEQMSHNAKAALANALAFVISSQLIEGAFRTAQQRIDQLVLAVSDEGIRSYALEGIDLLEHALADAKPNDFAKALSFDW